MQRSPGTVVYKIINCNQNGRSSFELIEISKENIIIRHLALSLYSDLLMSCDIHSFISLHFCDAPSYLLAVKIHGHRFKHR